MEDDENGTPLGRETAEDSATDVRVGLRCRFCGGLIEARSESDSRFYDLVGGWLCSMAPATEIEKHHRPKRP
jgi:hypothetical protein